MIFEIGALPKGIRFGEQARPARKAVREPAVPGMNQARLLLDERDARGMACEVVDVSPHGCRVLLSDPKMNKALRKIGAEFILELNGEVWVQVRVCWFAQQYRGLKIIRRLERRMALY